MERLAKFRRRKADRPHDIVDAAVTIFAERGFAATRLEDIAARAGVSKGALYLYYPTKEALFEAVVRTCTETSLDEIRRFIVEFKGGFPALLQGLLSIALEKIGSSRRSGKEQLASSCSIHSALFGAKPETDGSSREGNSGGRGTWQLMRLAFRLFTLSVLASNL